MKPSFEEVVERYIKLIYFFALRWIDKKEVDDMVQNTFLVALKKYPKFAFHTEGELKSWLLTICRNQIIDTYRKTKFIEFDEQQVGQVNLDEADKWLDMEVKKDEVNNIIRELHKMRTGEQEIIKLRIFDELSFVEIGNCLDISEAAAKMCFYRAIKRLRKKL
jgi:RNA polymerase sigma-70 factor (ECF subfamily)